MANPVVQPTEAETRVIPVYGDKNKKNESFTNPLATFTDEVLKSLPEPIPATLQNQSNKEHQPTPNPGSSSSGVVDQNFYIFKDGYATSMKGQVAPMATSAVANGPVSADFNWTLGQMEPVWQQQMKDSEMRKNRGIMETDGIPINEEMVGTGPGSQSRNGATPETSRSFPRFDPALLENKRCAFEPFYDTEAGGERVLKTNAWNGQFKGILPDAIFARNMDLVENPIGLKQNACFPSGTVLNRPWARVEGGERGV